jgi:hypothetical protein
MLNLLFLSFYSTIKSSIDIIYHIQSKKKTIQLCQLDLTNLNIHDQTNFEPTFLSFLINTNEIPIVNFSTEILTITPLKLVKR